MYLMLTASQSNNHFQPTLHLFLNPSCSYRLELSSSPFLSIFQESVGRIEEKKSSLLITSLFWLCILGLPTFLVRLITL
uniref:Ovule protein n=1 Tax=Romanomermis culicivorax TaxID=13658 RepID=A0A915JPD1_ROMCU